MPSGTDGSYEIASVNNQIRAASAELAGKDGLANQVGKNSLELGNRAAGAIGGLLLLVAIVSLMTDYSTQIISACAVVALALAALVWMQHIRLNKSREQQLRELAQAKTQEDKNA